LTKRGFTQVHWRDFTRLEAVVELKIDIGNRIVGIEL